MNRAAGRLAAGAVIGKKRRMPTSHGRQKQQEKRKKKRALARQKPTPRPGYGTVLTRAAALPFGPAYVSADFTETRVDPPRFVSVVVTRRTPGGGLLPSLALVDRTALGVKNAFVAEPMNTASFEDFLREVGAAHEGGMAACELAVAQSIVFHAVDYAASLGFDPHPDFPEMLFGPRPAPLLDTPLARPSRPVWIAGPDDDVDEVLETLDESVGKGNYDAVLPRRT